MEFLFFLQLKSHHSWSIKMHKIWFRKTEFRLQTPCAMRGLTVSTPLLDIRPTWTVHALDSSSLCHMLWKATCHCPPPTETLFQPGLLTTGRAGVTAIIWVHVPEIPTRNGMKNLREKMSWSWCSPGPAQQRLASFSCISSHVFLGQ